jgi:hypothetical protein
MELGRGVHLCVSAQRLEAWMVGMRGVASDALTGEVLCLSGEKQRRGGNRRDDKWVPPISGRGRRRRLCRDMGRERGPLLGHAAACASAITGGVLGHSAGLPQLLGCFPLSISFPFSNSFSISYFHSMLYLGLLCMYTCVAMHVHILMGSTRGQLGC